MKLWCHLPTGIERRNVLRFAVLLSMIVALITTLIFARVSQAAPNTNRTINFQGRLLSSAGAVVPDGHYNIQFKIYEGGTGTSANNGGVGHVWTESYVNNGGTNGVVVKNGFFSVSLGGLNPFNDSVDWDNDKLWLSMNVAGSAAACSTFGAGPCNDDGEMLPMKQMTATPYAINAGAVNGKTAANFVQLAQGVQNETGTNTDSIHINKTQENGYLLRLQNAGSDVLKIDYGGDIEFGNQPTHYIGIAQSDDNTIGNNISINAGVGGNGSGSRGGNLLLQGGTAGGTNGDGGDVYIDAGAGTGSGTDGSVEVGSARARHIVIGNVNDNKTQTIRIGDNTGGGNVDVTVGSSGTAASGTTKIQAKDDTVIATNGIDRATFDSSGNLFVGNGKSSGAPIGMTIQGTSSTTAGVSGAALAVQGGNSQVGNTNGGNLTLSGGTASGTGANGLVVIGTPTFQTAGAQSCGINCAINQANADNNGVVVVNATASGLTVTLNDPTITTPGRIVYVTAANNSNDFTLSTNGGGAGNVTSMRQNTTATMIWNGSDWTVAGASNSTTLQSAYNNTLQSAGGAELVVSSGTNANGLTIRDSSTNPVNGTLLEVQNASASTLFSVNSNVPEYATNGGAETAGATGPEFPANTWSSHNSGNISRHTPADEYVATGQASARVITSTSNSGISNRLGKALTPNMTYNVSFGTRLAAGSFTDMEVGYTHNGSGSLTNCKTNVAVASSSWTKVSCSFKVPSSGITTSNAIVIRQVASASRMFYIDNLSVTIAGNQNYATDGNANDVANFSTNWTSIGSNSTVSRNPSDGQEKSDSAQASIVSSSSAGLRNKLSINPLSETLYRISVYAKSSTALNDFAIAYTHDGTTYTQCVDYNTQAVTTSSWTEITCYVKTPATDASNPHVAFVQTASATRTIMVDTFEMTLATNTAANVQVGGGANGGQTTLFTLDQGASAPIADNNEGLLGSMYYDTTLGKIQCYEADGWGACGSSPDNIVTISPEYTNAVMQGPSVGAAGVGTMTSGLCSNGLGINTSICSTNETYNYYQWTSPQSASQTYGIYVTYQLPATFKSFASGSTSIKGRTDNGSNGGSANLSYKVFKNNATSGLTPCGSAVSISSGTVASWQTGAATGTADPSTCGFKPGDSIVFEIDMTASKNANAYVSNLGFAFSNN